MLTFANEELREAIETSLRRDFVPEQKADPSAAAMRLAKGEEILRRWYHEVNMTDTKNLPSDLLMNYQKAFEVITTILERERTIVVKGE